MGTAGYEGLRAGAAWIDLSSRGKLRATGDDRARLLHAMTTQHVEQMKPGDGAYAFFLNAQGRILGDVNLFCLQDSFLLDTEPETRQKLFEHIDRYIIADDVTLEDVTGQLATIAVEGPQAGAVLETLGAPLPAVDHAWQAWDKQLVARVASVGGAGFFVFVPVSGKEELLAGLRAAGVPEATPDEARTVRIEHGHPRYGEEITERYLIQETAQLQAVHFNKGCYLGQEIVERVRSRAQIHRILKRVEIVGTEVPAPGTKLKAPGVETSADAGEIASAAFSPASGKVAALAYIRTPFAEPGTELRWADALVMVV